ncbi:6-phosphogluconolactonase [Nocardia flavorosea]|uniref:6-phosphogluconolactonase n=1 Tax=Nocardia flavorosea TaxID=53429 RepID=A0A846YNU6_9NOCA|nr:6-phosphogluconolactonase [Nocardia flavorosea]NKY59214.1 6-phosphogluconolactonase [Nocardia flavorosea]
MTTSRDAAPAATVDVHPDSDALTTAAARRFVEVLVAAQAERGTASVVLTGGGTGITLLEKVRAEPGELDWSKLDIFWGDERFVPAGDPERNELQAHRALLDHVGVDPARIHTVATSDGEYPDPVEAAAEYATAVRAHLAASGGFDLHLLGMGPDGHINSLFPGHADTIGEEREPAVAVTDSPKPPPVRVTLTYPAIRRSRHVVLVVSGANKADPVAAALNGADPLEIPAAGAHGTESTTWILDEAAAAAIR